MAISLIDFLYGTNEVLAEKAYNLVKCWRVGVTSCIAEADLIVLSMYMKFLSTDLTDYNITVTEVQEVINNIVNIFNINNIVVEEGDIINYITNTTTNIVYNTTIINEVASYTTTYAGIGVFTVNVNHGLDKYNCTVVVTDTSTGSRIRVEVGIVETDTNNIVLSFSSDSSGEITIM